MDGLPPELIYEVVSHLRSNPDALCSLCRCSKQFLPICRQTLYWDIMITDLDARGPPYGVRLRNCRLLYTLGQLNKSLAYHVRRFHFAPSGALWLITKHRYPDALDDLIASLKLMVNLQHLTIHLPDGEETRNALQGCTFNQLESFSAMYQYDYILLPPGRHRLKQLRLWTPQWSLVPRVDVSHLVALGGNARTIENLLPESSISSLHWSRSFLDTISLTPALIQGFNNLDTLCITSSYYWDIEFLVPHLQGLRILHFTTDEEHTILRFETDFTEVVRLRGLQYFIYSDQQKYKLGYTSMGEQVRAMNLNASKLEAKTLAEKWFKELPNFKAAYFQIGNALREEKSFLVWERDTSEYRTAEGAEVWGISPWS